MWAPFLVVLFLFGLDFAPWSVLVAFSVLFSGILPLCCFFLKVLFFTALVGDTCFHWMLLLSLFLRRSSFLFYCCRNIVGLLSLLIVSVLGFPWRLLFYPGPHDSGTVDFVFQWLLDLFWLFFFSHVLRFLLPRSSCDWFCPFSHFVWLFFFWLLFRA